MSDFDRTEELTKTNISSLPQWPQLTEYMKVQVGFFAALSIGGYGFTTNIHPALIEKWIAKSTVNANIEKRLRKELSAIGLSQLPLVYVIEARSKSGKSRTKIHLHGYVVTERPIEMTRFKVAVERALHMARSKPKLKANAWHQQLVFDIDVRDGRGHGRWAEYITKNVDRYDTRICGRCIYFSKEMIGVAREMWALCREEPVGE